MAVRAGPPSAPGWWKPSSRRAGSWCSTAELADQSVAQPRRMCWPSSSSSRGAPRRDARRAELARQAQRLTCRAGRGTRPPGPAERRARCWPVRPRTPAGEPGGARPGGRGCRCRPPHLVTLDSGGPPAVARRQRSPTWRSEVIRCRAPGTGDSPVASTPAVPTAGEDTPSGLTQQAETSSRSTSKSAGLAKGRNPWAPGSAGPTSWAQTGRRGRRERSGLRRELRERASRG